MGWWSDLWIQKAQEWIYAPLQANQVFDQLSHTPIDPGKAYVSMFLRSMRIVDVREGFTKFYGTVDSHISIPQILAGQAQFHTLTTPSELKNIDATNLDRIIVMNRRLLGPIPYNGGDIGLEIGLFSVKSADLAEPFLNVLESISKAAGVSFVSIAQPFIEPLLTGVKQLFNIPGDSRLEIGLSTTYPHPETGHFLVMRAPQGGVETNKLKMQEDYRLVDETGQPVENYPYMIISIEASSQRKDWFLIPELADGYKSLQGSLRTGTVDEITKAWTVFQSIVQTCLDLLEDDQNKLLTEVNRLVEKRLQATPTLRLPGPPPSHFVDHQAEIPDLAQIPLY